MSGHAILLGISIIIIYLNAIYLNSMPAQGRRMSRKQRDIINKKLQEAKAALARQETESAFDAKLAKFRQDSARAMRDCPVIGPRMSQPPRYLDRYLDELYGGGKVKPTST